MAVAASPSSILSFRRGLGLSDMSFTLFDSSISQPIVTILPPILNLGLRPGHCYDGQEVSLPLLPCMLAQFCSLHGPSHVAVTAQTSTTPNRLSDLEDSRTSVFNTIIARLEAVSIPTSGLDKQKLAFALPSAPHDNWSTLLEKPILLSDEAINDLIQFTDTTGDQTDCPKGHTVFYLRSYPLKLSQLRELLSRWKQEDKHHPEVFVWEQMTKDITNDSITVYLRYVGLTSTHSGSERHHDDKEIRNTGMFSDFNKECDNIDPSIHRSVKIYHFVKAHLRPSITQSGVPVPASQEDADLRERVLISLFGLPSLLNRHPGGLFAVYQPPETDVGTFKRLGTKVFTKLMDRSLRSKPSDSLARGATKWMDATLEFASQHTKELELEKHNIDGRHKKVWIEQALPTRLLEQTVIVVIGDAIPLHALRTPTAFWKQNSRSSHLLKDFLSRLFAYEQDNSEWHPSQLDPLVDAGLLPFFDHRYWPNTTELCAESISLTREYVEATKPFLNLVLSNRNNKFVKANFATNAGRPMVNLLGELGNFTIQYYTNPGQVTTINQIHVPSNQVDKRDCFIQLPSFHPGLEKYGAGSTELRRVLDINLWKVCLAVDVTLDVLFRAKNDPLYNYSRYDTCRIILDHVERRWTASGADILFDQAKKAYKTVADSVDRWRKDPTRAYAQSCNGATVNITLRGKMTLYWQMANGEPQKVSFGGGQNIAPVKGEVMQRKIFFTSKGIDIQDDAGNSMTHLTNHTKVACTRPTLPGHVLRQKRIEGEAGIDMAIKLWEHETGLVFDKQFPKPLEQTTLSNFAAVPSRKVTTVSRKNSNPSKEQATIPKKQDTAYRSVSDTEGAVLDQFAFGSSRLDHHTFDTGHLPSTSERWPTYPSHSTCVNCEFIQVKCEGGEPCNSCESLGATCYSASLFEKQS
jgi:hypothetical protein